MTSRRPLLAEIVAALSPSLLAINPHLEVRAATARRESARSCGATAHRDGDVVTVVAKGLRLRNGENTRESWRESAKRAASQRALIGGALEGVEPPPGPWSVEITRVGRRLMDDDGATTSAKHVRDAVASWLGCDDGPTGPATWSVRQEVGRGYAVRVSVRPQEPRHGARMGRDQA